MMSKSRGFAVIALVVSGCIALAIYAVPSSRWEKPDRARWLGLEQRQLLHSYDTNKYPSLTADELAELDRLHAEARAHNEEFGEPRK
jgi:hypothetical protein